MGNELPAQLATPCASSCIKFVFRQVQVAVAKQAQSEYWQLRMALKSQNGPRQLRRCGLNMFSR